MKIPENYKSRVKSCWYDEDGVWIVLTKNWRCPDGYVGEKCIHEDTIRDAITILKKTRFCLS